MEIKYVQENQDAEQPVPECMCTQVPAEGQREVQAHMCAYVHAHTKVPLYTRSRRRVWMLDFF